jgi:hypothetical protein
MNSANIYYYFYNHIFKVLLFIVLLFTHIYTIISTTRDTYTTSKTTRSGLPVAVAVEKLH